MTITAITIRSGPTAMATSTRASSRPMTTTNTSRDRARRRAWRALTQGMAQSCTDEAAEVTGWPINQIQAAVQPNPQQSALLDDLGNAIVKASDEIKSHCPTSVAFTPTGRLAEMQQRLQGLVRGGEHRQPAAGEVLRLAVATSRRRASTTSRRAAAQASSAAQGQGSGRAEPAGAMQRECHGVADRSDRPRRPARRCAARQAEALQSAPAQAADMHQGRMPERTAGNAAGPARRRWQAPASHAAGVQTMRPALTISTAR